MAIKATTTTTTTSVAAVFLAVVLCNILASSALQGTATWYDRIYYSNNACQLPVPPNYMFAAGSPPIYNNHQGCGRQYAISCVRANNQGPGCINTGTFTVTIIDFCNPADGPCNGTFDLPKELFSQLAPLDTGNIIINYYPV